MRKISLHKEKERFSNILSCCASQLCDERNGTVRYVPSYRNPKETDLITTGAINRIWESWNHFCRQLVLLHIYGGYAAPRIRESGLSDLNKKPVEEALAGYLAPTSINKSLTRVYQYNEPKWGRKEILDAILGYYSNYPTYMQFAASLSSYETPLIHLHKVRNAAIHPCKSTAEDLRDSVLPSYVISNQFHYISDLSYCYELGSNQLAIIYWKEGLKRIIHPL